MEDSDESVDFSAQSEKEEIELKNPKTIFRDKKGQKFDIEDDKDFKMVEIKKLNEKIVILTS